MSSQTVERRVSAVFALYHEVVRGADGAEFTRVSHADRGELVTLTAKEEARLDALGALAPPGASREDVFEAIRRNQQAHQAAAREAQMHQLESR